MYLTIGNLRRRLEGSASPLALLTSRFTSWLKYSSFSRPRTSSLGKDSLSREMRTHCSLVITTLGQTVSFAPPFHRQAAANLFKGPIVLNNEPCLTRTLSITSGTRNLNFRQAVRQRDQECVVSRLNNERYGWIGFEAAHVFPLAYRGYWDEHNFGRWITTGTDDTINSVQNGILLRSDIHTFFNNYLFSINPDVKRMLSLSDR